MFLLVRVKGIYTRVQAKATFIYWAKGYRSPMSILVPTISRKMAKPERNAAIGRVWASLAPRGAVNMLTSEMPMSAGR